MSDLPPPSPYGGPPYPTGPGEPRRGMSNKAKFWIGVALALPAVVVSGFLTGIAGAVGSAIDPNGSATFALVVAVLVLEVVAVVVGIVAAPTRYWTLGILAGTAILFVLAAGACVVLIAGLSSSSA